MSIGNGAPAWPSVIVSNGGISPSDHIYQADASMAWSQRVMTVEAPNTLRSSVCPCRRIEGDIVHAVHIHHAPKEKRL